MNNWIELNDKLPEHEETVLITLKDGTRLDGGTLIGNQVSIAVFYNDVEDSGRWYPFFSVWEDPKAELTQEVLAWMPLPKPFNEEGE